MTKALSSAVIKMVPRFNDVRFEDFNQSTDLVCGNRRIAIAILQITRKSAGSEEPVEYQVPSNKNQHMMDGETIYKLVEGSEYTRAR